MRWAMSMRNAHGRYSLVRRARRTRRWVEPLDRSLICPIGLGQRQRQCCLRNRDRSCCRGGRWGGWRGWRHRTTIEDRNHREFETPRGAFNAERAMKQSACSTETRFAKSGVGGGLPPPQPNVVNTGSRRQHSGKCCKACSTTSMTCFHATSMPTAVRAPSTFPPTRPDRTGVSSFSLRL